MQVYVNGFGGLGAGLWYPSSRVAQSVQRLTTGWTVRGSNPGGARLSTRPDRPCGPPSLLYNGYRVFPGGKVRPGRAADYSPAASAVVMKEKSYTSTHPLGHNRASNGNTLPYLVNRAHTYCNGFINPLCQCRSCIDDYNGYVLVYKLQFCVWFYITVRLDFATLQSLVVTLFTTGFNVQIFNVLPTQSMYAPSYGSLNKR